MKELKHTKGPWRHQHDRNGDIVFAEISEVVCFPQLREDARLIATAPEMLQALIYVFEERERGVTNGLTDKLMQGVIEKATGMSIKDVLEATARQEAER